MSCPSDCTTVQLIEPLNDLVVETDSTATDRQESGTVILQTGQTNAVVTFRVPKISNNWVWEYLYVVAPNVLQPGAISVVPVTGIPQGFIVAFAGAPIEEGYTLYWRVVVHDTINLGVIDAPEVQYLQMPRSNLMDITFLNPRSNTNYGFSELRVENLHDPPAGQAIIRVQVYQKFTSVVRLAVNPTPPSNFYFLRMRTP